MSLILHLPCEAYFLLFHLKSRRVKKSSNFQAKGYVFITFKTVAAVDEKCEVMIKYGKKSV
jgi:hypothetical protein